MSARAALMLAALAAPVATLAGCSSMVDHYLGEGTPGPVAIATSYRHEAPDGRTLRRAAVLPFQDLTGHDEDVSRIRRTLVDELQKRQAFEVVSLDADCLSEHDEEAYFRTGVIRKDTLVRIAQRHAADAVLYGAVTRYHPYEPMVLGLQVTLVSASTGDVLWSANGLFDASDAGVEQDVHNWHDTALARSGSLEGWRLVLVSPSRFSNYACSRIADTL